MLKALALGLALATIAASVASAREKPKVYDLSRTETLISEKLVIVPLDQDGLVVVTETAPKPRKKEHPKS